MVLLKPFLEPETYNHFLLLVCAYRLLSVDISEENAGIVECLLAQFVNQFKQFYPKKNLVFIRFSTSRNALKRTEILVLLVPIRLKIKSEF